jgi:mRNA interferase RelE/StbE
VPYEIQFTPAARRIIKKFDRPIQERLLQRIETLAETPRPRGAEKLKGKKRGYYRVRDGDYRIIYTIDDSKLVVLIVTLGNRKEVYDNL